MENMNPGNFNQKVDQSVESNIEKNETQRNSFMKEKLKTWFGDEWASKANIQMVPMPVTGNDYQNMLKPDSSKFGEYSTGFEKAGAKYIENKEMPKIAMILNMSEFIGKSKLEVMKNVSETYKEKYRIPNMEDEQYFSSLTYDKIPNELKDRNLYYFPDSNMRDRGGRTVIPCAQWNGSKLYPQAYPADFNWDVMDRIFLLEK